MEGRAGQCQLVSRIKTTHLFTEVSCKVTGPKQGVVQGMSKRFRGLQGRRGQKVKGVSKLAVPQTSLSGTVPIALSSFLSITFLSRDARSHYGGVRKGASRVASSSAWVTDCCSALVAEEARAVGDWLRWSGSGH